MGLRVVKFFLLSVFLMCSQNLLYGETIKIKITVSVPEYTKPDSGIYIVGNIPELGGWNPSKIKMKKIGKSFAEVEILTDKSNEGARIEYKYTLGNWETVEKGKDFEEITNRSAAMKDGLEVRDMVFNWADKTKGDLKHTLTGHIEYHYDFYSKELKNKRTIVVYLPPEYKKDTGKKYPVLYMHDGQNIFDAATSFLGIEWNADKTAEKLIKLNKIKAIIIVGIYNNADRVYEYTHAADAGECAGGGGGKYIDFVAKEIKPFIDKKYRTLGGRENTAILGSSLGGLISLYAIFRYPEIFGMAGVVSPALFWADKSIFEIVGESEGINGKIWLDMGTEEGGKGAGRLDSFSDSVLLVREMKKLLIEKGFAEGKNLCYFEDAGAKHDESAWSKRFDKMLLFFYPPTSP